MAHGARCRATQGAGAAPGLESWEEADGETLSRQSLARGRALADAWCVVVVVEAECVLANDSGLQCVRREPFVFVF